MPAEPFAVPAEAPETITDGDGVVWLRGKPIDPNPEPWVAPAPGTQSPPPNIDELSDEELAAWLQPITAFMGHEYRLSDEDTMEMVRQVRDRSKVEPTLPFIPPGLDVADLEKPLPGSDEREARAVFGADNRVRVTDAERFLYPYSTIAAQICNDANADGMCDDSPGTCTATRIGPSTMITAAHCVHNQNTFTSLPRYAFGANNNNNAGITTPFQTINGDPTPADLDQSGCYRITVPGGWYNPGFFTSSAASDIAVIQLVSVAGNGTPCPAASATGWLGVRPNVDPNNRLCYLYGYPGLTDEGAPPSQLCFPADGCEPELGSPCSFVCTTTWGYGTMWGIGNTTVSDNNLFHPDEVTHLIDASPGQSGSAITTMFTDPSWDLHADPSAFPFAGNQGLFVIAVHKGPVDYLLDAYNRGPHIDSGWMTFLQTAGGLVPTIHYTGPICTCEPGLWGPICYCF